MFDDFLENPELQRAFKTIEESKKFKVDMSLMDELRSYVSVAKVACENADRMRLPNRYKTEEDLHKLCAFIAEVQAKRDRVIEIKVEFIPLQRALRRIWEEAIGLFYSYEHLAKLSPAPRRDAAINKILGPIREAMSKVDMIIDTATDIDRHLGNAYFTLKELKAIGTVYIEASQRQRGV